RLNEENENRRWTTMDDDAFRFGTLTQHVKGRLCVSGFLSASMVVYLRFNFRSTHTQASRLPRERSRARGKPICRRLRQRGQAGRPPYLPVHGERRVGFIPPLVG